MPTPLIILAAIWLASIAYVLHIMLAGSSVERTVAAPMSSVSPPQEAQPLPALPAFVVERQRENVAHLNAAMRVFKEDGDTPLTRAILEDAFREDNEVAALYREFVV